MKKQITFLQGFFLSLLFLGGVSLKAQTSFSDSFTGAISPNWVGNGFYNLTQANGVLTVKVNTTQPGTSFYVNLGGNINISSNPVLNIKLKTNRVCYLKVTVNASDGTSGSREVRIASAVDTFVNYCLDYSGLTFTKTSVNRITFAVNDFANSFSGTLTFDDLILGTGAAKFASICPLRDVTVYKGATGQKILVTDLANASGVTVGGAGALMSNISVSSITSNSALGGVCTITYDAGTPGTALVTVTATGTGGFGNNTSVFRLTVEDNNPPTINAVPDAKMAVGKLQTIQLSGISDGNASIEQPLTITAVSSAPAIIPNPSVSYSQGSPYATLSVTPASAGTATITLTVKDNGTTNNTTTINFNITSYAGFNYAPTINAPANQSMYNGGNPLKVKLTGISDGDGGTQTLTITATRNNPAVISSVAASYTQGRDTAILTINAAGVGKDTITVTVTDNGGNGSNNGNQSTQVSFAVSVLTPPPTGYQVVMNNFTADTTAGLWKIEDNGVTQNCRYVDTLGTRWIRININNKTNWTGLWYNLPQEIDVSKYPYMSYRIMASGFSPLLTHAYFWDVDTTRNTQGAHRQRDTITSNISSPHTVIMDFRDPLDQINDNGVPMNMSRVVRLLFNYHDKFSWPNDAISGVVYIGDILVGDKVPPASLPALTPVCTIDPVPTYVFWAGTNQQTIQLTGISNGQGGTSGITFQVLSSKTPFIPVPTISSVSSDGKATLTFTPATSNVDSSTIVIRVSAAGATTKEVRFVAKSVSDVAANAVAINVDATTKKQTVVGFGGFEPPEYLLEKYAQEQGCTLMRLTVDWDFEKNNDNADPAVLNRSGFNKAVLDFDYIRKAYEAGVTDFFITLWAPPAWMLQSLSSVAVEGAPDWSATLQKVDPLYYDEYVEYMVAIVRMIKEETGVEIAGFCPQNEPAFTEPYGGVILDPTHMAEVCGKLGKRLTEEGFATKPITSEQVFSQGHYPVVEYANALKADPLGNQYGKVVGTHYPNTNATAWNSQYTAAYPKELWATECTSNGNDFGSVLNQMESMIVGFNNGCGAWCVWGYNQGSSGNEDDLTKKEGMTFGYGTSKHFWAYKNWAKYVRKGAVQVKSTSGNSNIVSVAFVHETDQTLTIILLNKDSKLPYAVKFTGSAPASGYKVYRTSYYEKCIEVDAGKNGVYMLPPKSISTFVLNLNVNHAPTIDQVADKFMPMNGSINVNLTGITCGDPVSQNITVTAVSDNPSVIPNPTVNYTSPNTTGTLTVTAVPGQYGKVKITVTVKDDGGTANGGVDATTMSFYVTVNSGGKLQDVSEKASVFPNPASSEVTVIVPSELAGGTLTITDVTGKEVTTQVITGDNVKVDVSGLAPGLYMINLSNNAAVAKLKFTRK